MEQILSNRENVLWSIAILAGAVLVGLILHRIVFAILNRLTGRTTTKVDQLVADKASGPARVAFPLMLVSAAISGMPVTDTINSPLRHAILIGLIVVTGWFA